MTVRRVAVCGAAFGEAVAVLGLDRVDDTPDLVLVDVDDPAGITRAAAFDGSIPRIATGTAHDELLRALGVRVPTVATVEAALLGPLIAAAVPPAARRATRTVVVTGRSGGTGRTLLAAGVASRLAARCRVVVLDLTGSGAAGWWLGLPGGAWSDLEGLSDELTAEHLAVVAAAREALRLVGGDGALPSPGLASAATRAAADLADVVIVDAPPLNDERTSAVVEIADRVLLVVTADPRSAVPASSLVPDERVWLIASRCRAERLAGHAVMRALPDDPMAVRAAASGPSRVGGALGRAYDDLAELLAIDAS